MNGHRRLSLLCAALLASAIPSAVGAQEGLPPIPSIDDEDREGTPRPYAEDTRSGHVLIRATSGLLLPAGFSGKDEVIYDVAPFGLAVGGAVGIGLSRHAELDIAGQYGLLAAASDCPSCSSDTVVAGLGMTFHVAQGMAVDPYLRFGMAYRTLGISHDGELQDVPLSGRYHGLDFLQLTLGATFFPVPAFGLGPYAAADVGTFIERPADSGATRAYAFFQLGLRFELDPLRVGEKSGAFVQKSATAGQKTGGFPTGGRPSL